VVKRPAERYLSRIRDEAERNFGNAGESEEIVRHVSTTLGQSSRPSPELVDFVEPSFVGAKALSVKKYWPQRKDKC
jgi:hypothetical protein